MAANFSILILTRNEAENLPGCLKSVAWSDDVVVLDSYSTDQTTTVAATHGAKVFQRDFDDFAGQRNFALDQIPFKHRWVFHLDADERFNEELRLECERVIQEDLFSAFFVPNRIIFLGRWIRYCTRYPYPQVRLLKIGEAWFAKAGHGQREDRALRGTGHIQVAYDHFNFSKGVADWVEKHNNYSTQEARLALDMAKKPVPWRQLFGSDSMHRRRCLKAIHAKMPFRWALKFIYLFFISLGFLDGYPGFAYCILQSFYDFLISLKVHELRRDFR